MPLPHAYGLKKRLIFMLTIPKSRNSTFRSVLEIFHIFGKDIAVELVENDLELASNHVFCANFPFDPKYHNFLYCKFGFRVKVELRISVHEF